MNRETGRPCALGVDVGGTKIAGGLVDDTGAVSHYRVVPTPHASLGDPGLTATMALIEGLLEQARCDRCPPTGVGVGFPEFVTTEGELLSREVIDWRRQPRDQLEAFGLPVAVESDVRAAGTAETILGAGSNDGSCAYVSVGTGISYCLVEHGVPRPGASGGAIALGELEVATSTDRDDEAWTLERFASGAGLAARYRTATGTTVTGAAAIAEAAEHGDADAARMLADAGDALGAGIATLVHLLDPGSVVLGGGLSLAGGTYIERCVSGLERRLMARGVPRSLPVRLAALGAEAGVVGAALACFRRCDVTVEVARDDATPLLATIRSSGRAAAEMETDRRDPR